MCEDGRGGDQCLGGSAGIASGDHHTTNPSPLFSHTFSLVVYFRDVILSVAFRDVILSVASQLT